MLTPNPWRKLRRWTIVALGVLACGGSAALGARLLEPGLAHTELGPPALVGPEGLTSYTLGSAAVAAAVQPSVVFIMVEGKGSPTAAAQQMPFEVPEPFRRFFGPGSQAQPPQQPMPPPLGQGSGLIIDPAGYILTNYHVAGDAGRVTVRLPNGDSYPATVTGSDKFTDLAVIKIEPRTKLVAAALGDADQVTPGSWVMAVGFPFGERLETPLRYEPTVTVGVVSATHRQSQSDMPGRPIRDLIQTDAPINPGNSGGPLVDDHARVIGVNQSIFSSNPGGGNIGVGFAIAINSRTKAIIETLKSGESVVRGQLGASIEALTPALKTVYHAESGVFVNEVQPDGPAGESGIRGEDVITRYKGEMVTSPDQLVDLVHATKPGSAASVELLRDGKPIALEVVVGTLSAEAPAKPALEPRETKLGLAVEEIPPSQAEQMGIAGGVQVTAADPLGDAAYAGMRGGDVIVSINTQPVRGMEAYNGVVGKLKEGDPVVLRVWRSGHMLTVQIDRLSGQTPG